MWELDGFEDGLIERFREHPVLANITRLPEEGFAAILLQRRFLSLAFTPAYDLAIDLLRDEAGLRIARIILREEYPDSDRLAARLSELLAREDSTACFKEAEERSLRLKMSFYDQFLPALDRVRT
ncbi:hypothetical protein AB0P36_01725 [Streptomyces flavidovirens]|uniref:hypothetical protein n=1 Tax=Streptomyces flavidovirens TaxID=67298 RepID=UPI003435E15A